MLYNMVLGVHFILQNDKECVYIHKYEDVIW